MRQMFKKRAKYKSEYRNGVPKFTYINDIDWRERPYLNPNEVIKYNYTIMAKKPFVSQVLDEETILKVFEFAYDMTFGGKGQHRSYRSGGDSNRHNGEIFSNVFQGKLAEFGVYKKISDIYYNENRNISCPDLEEYNLGVWDKYDLLVDNLKLAIKSTKSKGNLLLLETKDWTNEGKYRHNLDGGETEYNAIILSRIGAKRVNDTKYTDIIEIMNSYLNLDFEEEAPRENLKAIILSYKWYYDVAGFITRDMLVTAISERFIINKGDMLQKFIPMDASNYYIQSGHMISMDEFKEQFKNYILDYEDDMITYENHILKKNIYCPKCGNSINIDLSEYITDTSSYERGMGEEIVYSIDNQKEKCSFCIYEYTINGYISEYPIGAENYNNIKIY